MTFGEMVAIAKDFLIAVAALTTSIVAVKGLKNWNRELKGKADFDTARSLIRATYKLRDSIEMSRSPLFAAHEFPEGYSNSFSRPTPQAEEEAWRHAFNKRWQQVWGALQEYDGSALEAEALWGSRIRSKTDELRQFVAQFRGAIDTFLADKAAAGEHFKSSRELRDEITSLVYWTVRDTDPFSEKIRTSVRAIEAELRPHLKRS